MRILLCVFAIFAATTAMRLSAQPYEHAAGLRAGYSSGLSYKGFFLFKMYGLELDALYNPHGFNVTGLYVHHLEPFRNDRFLVFLGGGAFGGNWDQLPSVGVALIGGVEVVVRDLPLNVGLDLKPMVNLYREYGIAPLDVGLSIRYRFHL